MEIITILLILLLVLLLAYIYLNNISCGMCQMVKEGFVDGATDEKFNHYYFNIEKIFGKKSNNNFVIIPKIDFYDADNNKIDETEYDFDILVDDLDADITLTKINQLRDELGLEPLDNYKDIFYDDTEYKFEENGLKDIRNNLKNIYFTQNMVDMLKAKVNAVSADMNFKKSQLQIINTTLGPILLLKLAYDKCIKSLENSKELSRRERKNCEDIRDTWNSKYASSYDTNIRNRQRLETDIAELAEKKENLLDLQKYVEDIKLSDNNLESLYYSNIKFTFNNVKPFYYKFNMSEEDRELENYVKIYRNLPAEWSVFGSNNDIDDTNTDFDSENFNKLHTIKITEPTSTSFTNTEYYLYEKEDTTTTETEEDTTTEGEEPVETILPQTTTTQGPVILSKALDKEKLEDEDSISNNNN